MTHFYLDNAILQPYQMESFFILRTFPDIEGEIINILLELRISNCSLIYDKYSILFFGIVTLAEL